MWEKTEETTYYCQNYKIQFYSSSRMFLYDTVEDEQLLVIVMEEPSTVMLIESDKYHHYWDLDAYEELYIGYNCFLSSDYINLSTEDEFKISLGSDEELKKVLEYNKFLKGLDPELRNITRISTTMKDYDKLVSILEIFK